MKTIFVPVSGTATDRAVFATALALGRSLPGAHLEFYHLRLDPCESALRDPHAHFCIGPAIGATLTHFEARDRALAIDSAHHFQDFCESNDLPLLEAPVPGQLISATWTEETNYPEERLLHHARHNDLIVLGRKHTLRPSRAVCWTTNTGAGKFAGNLDTSEHSACKPLWDAPMTNIRVDMARSSCPPWQEFAPERLAKAIRKST